MAEQDIVSRLDRLIGILELAHRDDIQRAREAIRSDKTYAAVLALTANETPAGKLSKAVQQKTKQSPKTVQRRIADLIELGALERIGAGGSVKYKATGLV
jgi:Fic family protein